ncbi:hypothetical protein OU994_28280 [Pseudoduganella sp. SL102]|uniref:hypothetical protein n=1 Tax=Pseudoduganella sp. SL102 TaxID=2995154 RepID=UPI00248D0251|nr:hypothetical protein [Pseudoduganella sp. SL102]WBS02108.1 hypothetical protein OU994_28280 [Pseudoduganella sp. SL102]
MTSTDIPRICRRLPPLAGLLEDMLDEAMRARRRRVMAADNPALNLNALRVADNTLDRLVQAAGMYGNDAAAELDARIGRLAGGAREAAVFLRIGLAVHTRDAALEELVARHLEAFPRAVRDACWFYPVPNGPLSDNAGYLVGLFDAGSEQVTLRHLAIELAGLRGETRLRGQLQALLDDPECAAPAHVALARMGQATTATRHYAAQCMTTGKPGPIGVAMELMACDPRIADEDLLRQALGVDPDSADAAWAIAASRDARKVFDHAATRGDLPAGLHMRIAALAGHPAGIIGACAAMAAADGPVTSAQADLLELALGAVPAEARCEPNDKADKSRALRALVLHAFRHAHVSVCNDADIGPWEPGAILADPAQAASVRLRDGMALPAGVPPLGRALPEVSHALRRWLYIERASLAGHAFALSPLDIARRQDAALMTADFVDAMRTT